MECITPMEIAIYNWYIKGFNSRGYSQLVTMVYVYYRGYNYSWFSYIPYNKP